MDLISITYEHGQRELDEAWGNILRNQVIFSSHDPMVLKMQSYQPTLVARQFGLCQDLLIPMFLNKSEVMLGFTATEALLCVALLPSLIGGSVTTPLLV